MLRKAHGGNAREVLRAFGQAILQWLNEMQEELPVQCLTLLSPMHALANGSFREEELLSFAQTAVEAYESLEPNIKMEVRGRLQDLSNMLRSPQQVHHGIVCDGCQQTPLQGRRFKCKVCRDYDLCQTCPGLSCTTILEAACHQQFMGSAESRVLPIRWHRRNRQFLPPNHKAGAGLLKRDEKIL